ncbi:MAG TPA: RsmB/NOP family class I SAM-dependent RNA methyltransferase [Rhizobiales bacterium]|nr:RsmB/NOP family class I SAM-dependent RNA methyltransferase [Hyphomicrobiales bacterium]
MKTGGRLSAAIEVLEDILARHRPASTALADWARSHRFAGSSDRAAIGNLVYDALRRKNSLSFLMNDDSPRALVLAAAGHIWKISSDEINAAAGDRFGPGVLTPAEQAGLAASMPGDAPYYIRGDYPQWLDGLLEKGFAGERALQGAGLASRAPVDLRANTLKTTPEKLLSAFEKFSARPGPYVKEAIRIAAPVAAGRNPNVEVEPAHAKGWFEVQDTASQIAAALAGARPGMQVADICAGAGGKTLALAAHMKNAGQIYAHDNDKHRLRPVFERLKRAGVRNVQAIAADEPQRLDQLAGALDVVFVDAPCSGTGSWRRKPDAKWRLRETSLNQRLSQQQQVLEKAAKLVKPKGRIIYVTCSVLACENTEQVDWFLARHPSFCLVPYAENWSATIAAPAPQSADGASNTLLLTPHSHKTDGFFIAILQKR